MRARNLSDAGGNGLGGYRVTKNDGEGGVFAELYLILDSVFIGVYGFGALLFFEVIGADVSHLFK